MDITVKEKFIALWNRYFPGAGLPMVFFYAHEPGGAAPVAAVPTQEHRCVLADINRVNAGRSLAFDAASMGCFGGRRYLGFSEEIMPNFEYFLSCGLPGVMEGERYKRSPDLVKETMTYIPTFKAPGKFIIFKRWDKIEEADNPEVVIFFAQPDVLAGLFTLANFDEAEPNGVYAPFGAGCATIVLYPYMERKSARPRPVLGMFDVSARPCVRASHLTFALPLSRFERMVNNMEESFLTTASWDQVRKRIEVKS
jgi:hypothetical protein